MDIEERFLWRHALICGLLWGLVVLMAVTLTQPVGNLAPLDLIYFMGTLSILWCGTGLVWAGGVKLAQEGRRPRVTFCLVLICAWAVSVMLGSYDAIVPGDGHLSRRVSLFDLAIYEFWINLFYGGLYTLGFFTIRRTQRLRRSLAALRLVRNQAETKLREARLQAVRGQLQPSILLEALDALKRTYIQDRQAGDRLFDLLIGFLRAAMPGLRRGASTLGAELTIIERYALLREALQSPSPPWRLQLAAPPADLSFPPLRLLPRFGPPQPRGSGSNGNRGDGQARPKHIHCADQSSGARASGGADAGSFEAINAQGSRRQRHDDQPIARSGYSGASRDAHTRGCSAVALSPRAALKFNNREIAMRRILSFIVILSCWTAASNSWAQNAADVQPRSYRLVLDNDKTRVLEFTARPGMGVCGSGIHSHPAHVTVLLTPAKVKVTQNGHTTIADMKAGEVFYEPAVTHEVENYGGGEVRSLIIELKTPEKPR